MKQVNKEQRLFDKKTATSENVQLFLDGCTQTLRGVIGQLNVLTPENNVNLEVSIAKMKLMQQLVNDYLASVGENSVMQTPAQSPFLARQPVSSSLKLIPPVFDLEQETGLNTTPVVELEQLPGKKRKLVDEDNTVPDTTVLSPTKRPRKSAVTPKPAPEPKPKTTLAVIKLAHNHKDVKGMIADIEEEHVRKREPKIKVSAKEYSNGDISMTVSTFTMFKKKGSAIGSQQAPVQENMMNYEPKKTRTGHIYGS